MKPLRVAHVSSTFPPYNAGTGNVCFANARELARRGHAVHVFTARTAQTGARDVYAGVTVHRLSPLVRLGNASVLIGLLRSLSGFDIIHLHYPFFGGELAAVAAKAYRTPLVITYHQDVLLEGVKAFVERTLRYTIGWATLRSASRLLFTSADYAGASYVRPLLRGREAVTGELPNSVDTFRFAPGPGSLPIREMIGARSGERVVLLVAALDRMHIFKGVEVFMNALARLPSRFRGVVVGDGDQKAVYENQAAQLGVASRTKFVGRVAAEDLPEYYRSADVTVLPSTTMGEAFGLVLIESLAAQTPVIASDLPGVRAVVTATVDGLLVTPGDPNALAAAIEQMLESEESRLEMGRSGRKKILANYRDEVIGDRLEAIYAELVS